MIAHGASGAAFKADVAGAYASVFGGEVFARMQAADRPTIVFEQNAEPLSLFCADESDGESLRACEQTNEALYRYEGADSVPALATACTASTDSKTWTCKLRDGVKFHDGATLDANDVVVSYALQWDTKHPLHKGRASTFDYWPGLWGASSTRRRQLVNPSAYANDIDGGAASAAPPVVYPATRTGVDDPRRDPIHPPPDARHDPGPARDRVRRVRARAAGPRRSLPSGPR